MTKKIRVVAAFLSCLTIASAASIGCGGSAITDTSKEIVRDCGKEDAAALSKLVLDFLGQVAGYVLSGEKIAWADVEAKAEHEGTVLAQCAFVEVASRFMGAIASASTTSIAATSPPSASQSSDAKLAVEKLRSATGGGRWRLIGGDVR